MVSGEDDSVPHAKDAVEAESLDRSGNGLDVTAAVVVLPAFQLVNGMSLGVAFGLASGILTSIG